MSDSLFALGSVYLCVIQMLVLDERSVDSLLPDHVLSLIVPVGHLQ
jgi:hypothetical protein